MLNNPFQQQEESGVRVLVRPLYLHDHSNPNDNEYVFAYFVRIENNGRKTVQLLSRHWQIYDSIGEEYEVRGDGVVGEQPTIASGGTYEYQSFCVLKSPHGVMQGSYRMIGSDDILFDVPIPRFELDANGTTWPTA